MDVLDVFNQDPFSVISLTDSINETEFIPGRAGLVVDWEEEGVTATSVMIERVGSELKLLNPTPRGGPGESFAKDMRNARILRIPHYQVDDSVMAESLQGVRAFGTTSQLQAIEATVNNLFAKHSREKMDPTLEYQRLGAIKGLILNGDGSTLYNLFDEFGVTQETEVDFDLDAASPVSGALRKKCTAVIRLIAKNLGGMPYREIRALCGDAFWDDLTAHSEFRASYLAQVEARQLREGLAYETVSFGGIIWENYRGAVNNTNLVNTDKAHIFPVGVPGLWRTVYAPADYIETVNTPGLPKYAKQWRMPNDKGIFIEAQMNPLNYCTRPKTLILAKRT